MFPGYSGTVTISSGFGTMFYCSPKTEPVRAREVIDKWRDGGGSAKALIDAAVLVLIDDAADEDDE